MRKIEDLKENECIEIRTKKEAKGIAKLCKHIINYALQEGGDIAVMESWARYEHPCIAYNKVNENSSYISYSYVEFFKTHKRTIIPASDFLPKKNSLKKRIKALESKVDTMLAKDCVVKECEVVKHENGTYCIKGDFKAGNKLIVNMVFNEDENTFDKAFVSEVHEVKDRKLEVGRWYKSKEDKAMFCIKYIDYSSINGIESYGFNAVGNWSDSTRRANVFFVDEAELATNEDVEAALIQEAKKRGFKKGIKWLNPRFAQIEEYANMGELVYNPTDETVYLDNNTIFYNGKWATIISKTKEIDWSKPGQLVSTKDGVIVITASNITSKDTFSGVALYDARGKIKIGFDSTEWCKDLFTLHTQPITLCNEE